MWGFFVITALAAAPSPQPEYQFDRTIADAPAAEPSLAVEVADATSDGDWARDRDFEVSATWRSLSFTINHHVLDRNAGEAQVVVSYALEF